MVIGRHPERKPGSGALRKSMDSCLRRDDGERVQSLTGRLGNSTRGEMYDRIHEMQYLDYDPGQRAGNGGAATKPDVTFSFTAGLPEVRSNSVPFPV
jgi:hypothetical protein